MNVTMRGSATRDRLSSFQINLKDILCFQARRLTWGWKLGNTTPALVYSSLLSDSDDGSDSREVIPVAGSNREVEVPGGVMLLAPKFV